MKILYINTLFTPNIVGGAEKIVFNLAQGMEKRGHSVTVITTSPPGDKISVEEVEGIKVYYVPLENFYWPFDEAPKSSAQKFLWHLRDAWNQKMSSTVKTIIRHEKPDVVHIHNLAGFSGTVLKDISTNFPTILTLHDYYFKCFRSTMFKNGKNCNGQCWDCKILSLPRKVVSKRVRLVVGVSNFVLNRVASDEYFRDVEKDVIHNSIREAEISRNTGREIVSIGYIGKITEEKGFSSIVETLKALNRSDWRFVFAGRGDEKTISTSLIKLGDNAKYLGFVEASEFYKNVDLIIVPSLWNDPYPTVILEAFARGIPVIGRDRGGIAEIISLVSQELVFGSNEELSSIVKRFLDMQRSEYVALSQKSYAIARSYTFEDFIKKYEAKYVSVGK
ncbi:glycosyltransferase family 4 protein [Deinococcus sp.]|uniref:glycosyltransferase family 4 protein n=1 Tax=Deinococcus sp. TaxID=47478 RepID=UPI003CC69A78